MRGSRLSWVAVAALAIALAGCPKRPLPAVPPPPVPAPGPGEAAGECKRVVHILVEKSKRTLTAECKEGGPLVLPIALARERGPKREQGDQRMPEGDYRVAGPPRTSRFHLFIPFDYPSRADADRALAEHRIDEDVHAAIAQAHKHRRMPPQDTALGGALGIHGEGVRWRGNLLLNWTDGCVAVSDHAIEQLARMVRPGTPIRIEP